MARALQLARRAIEPSGFDYGVLGRSVPQTQSFYGLPWLAGLVGAARTGGPTLMPVSGLLVAMRHIEHARLREIVANQL